MKLLRSVDRVSYMRFRAEMEALRKLDAVPGVVPMLDRVFPDLDSKETPWLVMPIGLSFDKYRANRKMLEVVQDFISLSVTLETLHANGIHHRDIKPANLLFLDGRLCFSDFGLVKYPARSAITPKKQDVGPKFTMAPEMRRYASEAPGGPADVYSFAKSLWIALTNQPQSFDGQYSSNSSVSLKNYVKRMYTTKLDQLLVECTDNDPVRRPQISDVTNRLREWLETVQDFDLRNRSEWAELQHSLFPLGAPARAAWQDVDAICAVLHEVAKTPGLNHMFYPSGGGNTITGVSRAAEEGMIALHVGDKIAEILKPLKLAYESFGVDPSWNYFRLEAAPVPPTGVPNSVDREGIYEALCELEPGVYVPYHHWDNDEYAERSLPEEARPVGRYLQGSFVFFGTRSAYNQDPATYDARHNKMSEEEFREYIERNAARSRRRTG